jgi:hypothetical protein
VISEDGLEIKEQGRHFARRGEDPHPDLGQIASGPQDVGRIAAQPVHVIHPQLAEAAGCSRPDQMGAVRPLRDRDHARHAVVDVAAEDLDLGYEGDAALELLDLSLDRGPVALVVAAHPSVCRHPPDRRFDRHRHRSLPPAEWGRTRGRPRATRSAAS